MKSYLCIFPRRTNGISQCYWSSLRFFFFFASLGTFLFWLDCAALCFGELLVWNEGNNFFNVVLCKNKRDFCGDLCIRCCGAQGDQIPEVELGSHLPGQGEFSQGRGDSAREVPLVLRFFERLRIWALCVPCVGTAAQSPGWAGAVVLAAHPVFYQPLKLPAGAFWAGILGWNSSGFCSSWEGPARVSWAGMTWRRRRSSPGWSWSSSWLFSLLICPAPGSSLSKWGYKTPQTLLWLFLSHTDAQAEVCSKSSEMSRSRFHSVLPSPADTVCNSSLSLWWGRFGNGALGLWPRHTLYFNKFNKCRERESLSWTIPALVYVPDTQSEGNPGCCRVNSLLSRILQHCIRMSPSTFQPGWPLWLWGVCSTPALCLRYCHSRDASNE